MKDHVVREGRGLHTGERATVTLRRITGERSVLITRGSKAFPISAWSVHDTQRGTTVRSPDSGSLATVEHLFAALAGASIRRGLSIDVEGPELPLLDGGARAWADALAELALPAEPTRLVVRESAAIASNASVYRFTPPADADDTVTRVIVDFRTNDPSLMAHAAWSGDAADFRDRIAPARTFAFAAELPWIAAQGLARHVAPESAVVLGAPGEPVLSRGSPFTADEPARHKLLDLVGDLYLYGGPPRGMIEAVRPGHKATHEIVREGLRRGVLAFLAAATIFAGVALARPANASPYDDPYSLPDAPPPPTLPELTHADIEVSSESTLGILEASGNVRGTAAYVQRFAFEYPVAERRYFLGAAYEAAAGSIPASPGSPRFVSGDTEIYGRTVWATRAGLAFGGQLGFMLPTATFGQTGSAATTGIAAAALRPWDNAFFNGNTYAFRPAFDARLYEKNFVVQARQGLDWAGSTTADAPRVGLAAVTELFIGYKVGDVLGLGLEAFELFMINANATVADDSREVFTFSPSVRILTPVLQPALSALLTVHDSVAPSVTDAWGVRITFTVLLEHGKPDEDETTPILAGRAPSEWTVYLLIN